MPQRIFFRAVSGMPSMDPIHVIRPGDVSPGFAPFVLDRLFFFKTFYSVVDYANDWFFGFFRGKFSRICMQCKNVPFFSSYYHITGDLRFTEAKKRIAKNDKIAVGLQKIRWIMRIIKEQKRDNQYTTYLKNKKKNSCFTVCTRNFTQLSIYPAFR
jgi:hypothetical protein